MPPFFAHAHRFLALRKPASLLLSLALAALLCPAVARAQFGSSAPVTQVNDPSALKPPPGARVAIVEFDDMECPFCGKMNPVIKAAAAKYGIPWIRHDFLIPGHIWSPVAAVNARWFDTRSKALGDEYRDQVFANQASIYSLNVLRQFTERFAQSHGIVLPFVVDPQGKLAAEVNADKELGLRTGIFQTPTIFVVTAHGKGAPFIEVQHPDQDLSRIIDQAIAGVTPVKPAVAKKRASK
jgi:protein-disulfide isomerase